MNDSRERRKQKRKRRPPATDILTVLPIASWPWPRIIAFVPQFPAIPHGDDVFYHFWAIAQQGVPIMRINYGRTDLVRNQAAKTLLGSDYTHVLMLDQDHQHPHHIVQALARWVIADPTIQVVGGLNFRRGAPYDPCAYLLGEDGRLYPPADWEEGLLEVDAIGTGSLLIAREVFEKIDPPWFFNDYSHVLEDRWPGEDLGFCSKCREAGIKMYVDTTISSPHMIDAVVDRSSFEEYTADHPSSTTPASEFRRYKPLSMEEDKGASPIGNEVKGL